MLAEEAKDEEDARRGESKASDGKGETERGFEETKNETSGNREGFSKGKGVHLGDDER